MEIDNDGDDSRQEQEEAFVALIEHRTREVQHLRHRLSYYQSQVTLHIYIYIYIRVYIYKYICIYSVLVARVWAKGSLKLASLEMFANPVSKVPCFSLQCHKYNIRIHVCVYIYMH